MLTIAECRAALGAGHSMSDEELERLRAELYALARASADAFIGRPASSSMFDQTLKCLSESDRDAVVERAAILEFDAGRTRDAAEREALAAASSVQPQSARGRRAPRTSRTRS